MSPHWLERFVWWLCEKVGHPFPKHGWVFDGRYHRDCRWCGRIVSEPIRGEK
jgi:hypothetical protein